MEQYIPQPKNLDGVIVYGPFRELVNKVAAKAHQNWMAERIKEGMTLSELLDLKPWNALTDAQKASRLDSAEQAVKLLMHDFPLLDIINGDISFDREKIVDAVAENAHEVWVRQMMDDGWTYGETCDIEAKTHTMLKPYDELLKFEKAYYKAYGEIAFDEIEKMATVRKEMIEFGDLKHGMSAGKVKDAEKLEEKQEKRGSWLDPEGTFYTVFPEDLEDGIVPPGCSIGVDSKGNKFLETFSQNSYVPKDGLFLVKEVNEGNLYNVCTKKQFDTLYKVGEDGIAKSVDLVSKTMKPALKQLTPEEKTKARRAKSASIYKSLVAAEQNRSQGIKIK